MSSQGHDLVTLLANIIGDKTLLCRLNGKAALYWLKVTDKTLATKGGVM